MRFDYTLTMDTSGSSFVNEVYWNVNNHKAFVVLYDETNDEERGYIYSGVSSDLMQAWMDADSKGRFYNQEIKKKVGPGEEVHPHLVFCHAVPIEQVQDSARPTVAVVNNAGHASGPQVSFKAGGSQMTANSAVPRTYTVTWVYEGKEMPYVTEAADDSAAVDNLLSALSNLGLTGARALRVTREL